MHGGEDYELRAKCKAEFLHARKRLAKNADGMRAVHF
jgi:hypothetical protein